MAAEYLAAEQAHRAARLRLRLPPDNGGPAAAQRARVPELLLPAEPAIDGAGIELEAMAFSAMPRFKVSIRLREGVAIDQRIRWGTRLLMIRQMISDPRLGDRIVMRCEEVRQ